MKIISICLDQHKNIFLREIVLVLAAIWWRIDSQTHESELLLAFCCLRWNTSPNTHSVLYHVWQFNLRVLSIQSEFCEIICFLFLLCFLLSSYCLQSASRFSLSLSSCYTYFLMILQLFLPLSLSSYISFLFLPMHCFTGVPYLLVQAVPVVTHCHTMSPEAHEHTCTLRKSTLHLDTFRTWDLWEKLEWSDGEGKCKGL